MEAWLATSGGVGPDAEPGASSRRPEGRSAAEADGENGTPPGVRLEAVQEPTVLL